MVDSPLDRLPRGTAGAIAWTFVGAIVLPGILVATIWNGGGLAPSPSLRSACLSLAIALAGAALLARLGPEPLRAVRSTPPDLVLAGAGLLVLAISWNRAHEAAHFAGVTGHIFRRVFLTYGSPFYGRSRDPELLFAGLAIAICLGAVAWLAVRGLGRPAPARLAAVLALLQLAFAVAIGFSEFPERAFGNVVGHATFASYAAHFASPGALLSGYVDAMSGFQGFGRHYPPGIPLVISLVGPEAAKLVFLLMPTLGLWAVLGIARELELGDEAIRCALLLFASSATLSIFPSLVSTSSLLLLGAIGVQLTLRMLRTGSTVASVGLGLTMAVFALCSFAIYLVALPMICLTGAALATGRAGFGRCAATICTAVVTFALLFGILWLVSGFDLIACLVEADRVTRVAFVPNATAFALRASGGLLAYALTVGIPITFFAVMSLIRRPDDAQERWIRAFSLAMVLGVLLGGLSGRAYLETERIFMLYTPLLVIPAGWELERRLRREGEIVRTGAVAVALGLACTYGLFVAHHF